MILLIAIILGAPGDARYVKCYPGACDQHKTLTSGQETSLTTCLSQMIPGMDTLKLREFHCVVPSSGKVGCSMRGKRTARKRDYVADRLKGHGVGSLNIVGDNVTYDSVSNINLDTSEISCIQDWAATVFSGISKTSMFSLIILKARSSLIASWEEKTTASPSAYISDEQANRVRALTGVEP